MVDATDNDVETPLMLAICLAKRAAVKRLIKRGADVNASSKFGSTALHYAARYDSSVVDLLLKAKGEVDAQNCVRQPALLFRFYSPHHLIAPSNCGWPSLLSDALTPSLRSNGWHHNDTATCGLR